MVPLEGLANAGATRDADRMTVGTPTGPFVTFLMTSCNNGFSSSVVHSAFSAAAVTSSAAVPVTEVGPDGIGVFDRGPGVDVGPGMPVDRVKATAVKVGMTHRLYGREWAADAAEVGTSGGILWAS